MPPLHERTEDIPALALRFIEEFSKRIGKTVVGMTAEAESILCDYHWPGNVRELRNAIQCAITMASLLFIRPKDLPPEVFERGIDMTMLEAILEVKRQYLIKAVAAANGSHKKAARLLNIHPKALPRALDRLRQSHLKRDRTF